MALGIFLLYRNIRESVLSALPSSPVVYGGCCRGDSRQLKGGFQVGSRTDLIALFRDVYVFVKVYVAGIPRGPCEHQVWKKQVFGIPFLSLAYLASRMLLPSPSSLDSPLLCSSSSVTSCYTILQSLFWFSWHFVIPFPQIFWKVWKCKSYFKTYTILLKLHPQTLPSHSSHTLVHAPPSLPPLLIQTPLNLAYMSLSSLLFHIYLLFLLSRWTVPFPPLNKTCLEYFLWSNSQSSTISQPLLDIM
jgi:hypothetical protein